MNLYLHKDYGIVILQKAQNSHGVPRESFVLFVTKLKGECIVNNYEEPFVGTEENEAVKSGVVTPVCTGTGLGVYCQNNYTEGVSLTCLAHYCSKKQTFGLAGNPDFDCDATKNHCGGMQGGFKG